MNRRQKTELHRGVFIPLRKKTAVRQLHNLGKEPKEIATFLGLTVPDVKKIVDPDFAFHQTRVLELRPPTKSRHRYTETVCEECGTFLDSQEGREALERVRKPYSSAVPEHIQDRRFRPVALLEG